MKAPAVNIHREKQPDWFRQSRLGIFIHWGVYSVPAYAPDKGEDIGTILSRCGSEYFYRRTPYAEWYQNSMALEGSPTDIHHREHYGSKPYSAFAEEFRQSARSADPEAWVRLFKDAGASYVVLVTKHHDGFTLFNSRVPHPRLGSYGLDFDFTGALAAACRSAGLRFGIYYSSLLDWTFTSEPIHTVSDMFLRSNISSEYVDYCRDHWLELIDRYSPDILWSDIGYPPDERLPELFRHYYERVPEGLVNDRWSALPDRLRKLNRRGLLRGDVAFNTAMNLCNARSPSYYDYRTQEYSSGKNPSGRCFELCRGIDLSFGYNKHSRAENFMSPEEVRALIERLAANNGRLLLNVGPDMHGNIPEPQARVLRGLA
ncbi:MAG: alpha-L-fucosidase [Oscillospiraceae bacterium]|jgi:alpha-L-fucosidase|nr:alpha-L-fucosidase [Oscillospiraceae bacterium]